VFANQANRKNGLGAVMVVLKGENERARAFEERFLKMEGLAMIMEQKRKKPKLVLLFQEV